MFSFQGFSVVIYQALSFFWLISGLYDQTLTGGDFALVLMINISIINCLWNLSDDFDTVAEKLGDITQGLNIALQQIKIDYKPNAKDLVVKKSEIVFKNVQFHYKGSKPLFNNL